MRAYYHLGIYALAVFVIMIAFLVNHRPAFSAEDDSPTLRLIETAPGVRAWMTEEEVTELSHKQHETGFCGGFYDVTDFPNADDSLIAPFALVAPKSPRQQDLVAPLMERVSPQRLHDRVTQLSQFHNRYYKSPTGVESMNWIKAEFEAMASSRTDVTVRLFQHKDFPQPSVIARIEGKGPNKNEIVVLGGHGDSVNWKEKTVRVEEARAPGADDNASGTSTLMEIFNVLMDSGYQPDRTLEFMIYAGEERGLLGSQHIAETYKNQQQEVVAVLQYDMTMFAPQDPVITFIVDNVDPDLTAFTQLLVQEYLGLPIHTSRCLYACSDHASWNRYGYSAVYPFEAPANKMNKKIHTVEDTIAHLDTVFGAHYAKLGLAYAVELATE